MTNKTPELDPKDKSRVWRLIAFFSCLYIIDGFFQSGVLMQPLQYFLKTDLGWAPDQVTNYMAVLMLPWSVKPIYGIVSDFIPLFGYRRRSYLVLMGLASAGAFAWVSTQNDPHQILIALTIGSTCMAAGTALASALTVEQGKKTKMSGTFVNQQWIWFMAASVLGSLAGGWLASKSIHGLHLASYFLGGGLCGALLSSWFLVEEEKAPINIAGLKASGKAFIKVFSTPKLILAAVFLFFYAFSPSFGTPLYYYQVDKLHFSQEFIGMCSAIGACASVVGGFLYSWLQKRITMKTMLYLSITIGVASQASYLLLFDHTSAIILAIANGCLDMITLVSILTLAVDYCPDGAEGFSYAALMSVRNGAMQLSAVVGAKLYVGVLHSQLTSLIILSACITAFAYFLVPMLRLGNRMPGEKEPTEDKK